MLKHKRNRVQGRDDQGNWRASQTELQEMAMNYHKILFMDEGFGNMEGNLYG